MATRGRPWSETEVDAIVRDYFFMFHAELRGSPYNKTQHRRALQESLQNRSDGSIERKHQNITAVLSEMGYPGISGYKPLGNYQRLLADAVHDYLMHDAVIDQALQHILDAPVTVPPVEDILSAMVDRPKSRNRQGHDTVRENRVIPAMGAVDYLRRESENQRLGDAGESFVLNYERARLIRGGKESLADRVEHVAATIGPSAGYDIKSFELSGLDRLIEAKTTVMGMYTPFYVTPNELRVSKEESGRYFLYRVFHFRKKPQLFSLQGNLEEACALSPSEYKARVG